MKKSLLAVLLVATAVAAGCGGGDSSSTSPASSATSSAPKLLANIAVPSTTSPAFSFDIGYVEAGRYYLSDRNSKSVDVVDTRSNALIAQIQGGFTGAGA